MKSRLMTTYLRAYLPGAAREKSGLDAVYALGGGVGDVPPTLQPGNGFERIEKVDAGEQFAPLLICKRLQPETPADDQLRLCAKELHQLGNRVATGRLLARHQRSRVHTGAGYTLAPASPATGAPLLT